MLVYFHCSSHVLNLALLKVCGNSAVIAAKGLVSDIANYFRGWGMYNEHLKTKTKTHL